MMDLIDLRLNKENPLFKRLTERAQIENPDVLKSVMEIIDTVRKDRDKAVIEYTKRFDKVELDIRCLKVSQQEIHKAYDDVDRKLIEVIRRAKKNIEEFHSRQKENSWFTTGKDGIILGQIYRPLETVGIYVPGGTAPLISSVLMTAVPAKVAGVKRIIMATPPGKDGKVHPAILVAANEAGVDEIFRMGGAQAIAAMAFGTETVPRVDKIFGPGNIYVATAKRMVFGYCDIDMFAGPSEIAIIADDTAVPKFVAADMLSQAEHDVLASAVLVTTSEDLAKKVQKEIERQFENLPRKEILERSLKDYSAVVITESLEEAVEVVNRIAPEHLELCVAEPFSLLDSIRNAGAIFLGNYSSEPLGDYFAGPNHVLPTGGTARFFSPLNVGDFVKKSSLIYYTEKALQDVKDDVVLFAESEGLSAHANAIKIRFEE